MSSGFVDLNGNVRWTDLQLKERVAAETRSELTRAREDVLLRRSVALLFYIVGQMLPPGNVKDMVVRYGRLPSPEALEELSAAADTLDRADSLAAEVKAAAELLHAALDYEGWRIQQAALPPLPVPDPDTGITPEDSLTPEEREAVEAWRAELQASMNAASAEVQALVAQRDAWRASQAPPVDSEPSAEEVQE